VPGNIGQPAPAAETRSANPTNLLQINDSVTLRKGAVKPSCHSQAACATIHVFSPERHCAQHLYGVRSDSKPSAQACHGSLADAPHDIARLAAVAHAPNSHLARSAPPIRQRIGAQEGITAPERDTLPGLMAPPEPYFLTRPEPFKIRRHDTQRVLSIFLWHYNEGVLSEPRSGVANECKFARVLCEGAGGYLWTERNASLATSAPIG